MAIKTPLTDLPVIVQKAYDFSIWLIRKVESFPRSFRFSIGERLVDGVTDLLMRLVDAAYSRDKFRILVDVNNGLNRLRFQLRMAKDLQLMMLDRESSASRSYFRSSAAEPVA